MVEFAFHKENFRAKRSSSAVLVCSINVIFKERSDAGLKSGSQALHDFHYFRLGTIQNEISAFSF